MAKNPQPPVISGSGLATLMKRARSAQIARESAIVSSQVDVDGAIIEITHSDGKTYRVYPAGRVIRSVKSGKMVEAVMHAAADEGLTVSKDGRIAGRVSSELIAKAKAKTGITSDTELLEFALANVAIEDNFAEAFHAVRGTVDPDLDFGF